ncbi:HNH endonuclease [Chroococcidiopsis sp.]|uniref:HNH endonuclease n=1 Tax=Chroococcidiopsis sp. TaxID=3088168 RepID=UPI003F3C10A9
MTILSFDATKFYLGKLCPRKHDWNDTGKTLRYCSHRKCVQCGKEQLQEARKKDPERHNNYTRKYRAEDPERYRQYRLEAYYKEPEKHRAISINWKNNNRDRVREYMRRKYWENPEYHKEKSRNWYCNNPEKARENRRRAYWVNPEKYRAQALKSRLKNKEKKREADRLYRLKNADKIKETRRLYQIKNPELKRIASSRYRAQRRLVHRIKITPAQVCVRIAEFDNKCCYCGCSIDRQNKTSYQIDHFLPVAKGGCDTLGNIVIACPTCNASKGDRDPHEWYSRQPFYLHSRWLKILKVLGKTAANYNQLSLF